MRNAESWRPSKYVLRRGRLAASRDPKEVGVGSRLIGDRVAAAYEEGIRKHARGELLDLGCGKVPLYLVYKDVVKDNVCVDRPSGLHGNDYLDLAADLTQPLPFPDGRFDTIILSDVLEHIPEPQHLWAEMARVLAPGGKALVSVPFFYWLHESPHDYYRYTRFALRRFVEGAGLRLVRIRPLGGSPEIMADVFAKNVMRLGAIGRALAAFVQWLTSALTRTRLGKRLSQATSAGFPLGYFLIAEKPG